MLRQSLLTHRTLFEGSGHAQPRTLIDSTTRLAWTDRHLPLGLRGVMYTLMAERFGGRSDLSQPGLLWFGAAATAPLALAAA